MCDSQLLPELHCSVNALRQPGLLQLVGNRDLEMKTENKKTCYWLRRNSLFTQKMQSIRSQYTILLRRNTQMIRIHTQFLRNSFTHQYAKIRNFTHSYAISIRRNTRSIRIDTHQYALFMQLIYASIRINTQLLRNFITQIYAVITHQYAAIRSHKAHLLRSVTQSYAHITQFL